MLYLHAVICIFCPQRYDYRNVYSHTTTVPMVGSATVAVCVIRYDERNVALAFD